MIAPVRGALAGGSLFLDVRDLAVRTDFAVAPGDAAASERCESKQANKTHHDSPRAAVEQFPYRWNAHTDAVVTFGFTGISGAR